MRWIVGIPLALTACLVALAFLGPQLVDWNSHKTALEDEISRATGYRAEVDGNIGASLLPTPRVTVAAVRLLRNGVPVATIRWMEAKLRLSDLLRGDLQVVDLVLIEPSVSLGPDGIPLSPSALEQDKDGQQPGPDDPATGPGPANGRAGLAVSVRDASVTLDTGYGRWQITGIDGSMQTPTVGQRLSVAARIPLAAGVFNIEARFAPPQTGVEAPVSFKLASADKTVRARFGGTWRLTDAGLGLNGGASIDLSDAARLSGLFGDASGRLAALEGPIRLETELSYRPGGHALLDLADLSVNGDRFSAVGEAAVALRERPRVDLALRFSRLALDEAIETALPPTPARGDDGVAPSDIPTEGEDGGAGSSDLLILARDLPVDLSLQISAAGTRFRGKLVQRLAVRGSIEDGAVTLEELSARLPGGADLSIAGFGDLRESPPTLEGNASLRADDLRRFLAWTGLPVPGAAPERLRRFSLVSGVSLRPGRLDIVDAAIEVDDLAARGAAAVALRDRLGVGLRLEVDQINLDAFRLASAASAGEGSVAEGAGRTPGDNGADAAVPARTADGLAWDAFDATLDLKVGRVIAAGVPFNDVSAAAVLREGALTLNRASVSDAAGVSGQASGRLDLKAQAEGDRFAFSGRTADLGRLTAVLDGPDWITGVLRSIGPGTVDIDYDGSRTDGPLRIGVQGSDGGFFLDLLPSGGDSGMRAVDVRTGRFSAPDWRAESLSGRLELARDTIALRDGRGRFNGGALALDVILARQGGGIMDLSMSGRIDGLKIDRNLGDLDGALGLAGAVTLSGEIHARGSDWQALESTNQGSIDLAGSVAVLVGPPRTTIVNVRKVTEVRAALRDGFSRPGALSGRIRVENGTLVLDGLALQGAGGAAIEATGTVDVKRRSLSAQAVLETPGDDGVRARLSASGNSAAPNLRLSN